MKTKLVSGLLATSLIALLAPFVSQPVLAATCTSTGAGNWSADGTWNCGHVPVDGDTAVVASGHTVTVDTNTASLAGLTVNGTLTVGNDATARAVMVNGDVAIANTGAMTAGSVTATHAMTITGNLTNDGVFDGLPGSGRIINVTFNKDGNQTVSGAGTTRFNNVTLNMGASNANVLDVQAVISMTSGGLTLSNGTFKLSSASTITPFAGSKTIGSSAGFYLNHASAVSNWGSSGSLTVNGALTIASGAMTIGSGTGNELEVNGTSAVATVSGGTLNVAGRVRSVSSGLLTISSGEIVVPTVSHSHGTYASFYMQPTGKLTMSGGTVTIQQANGGAGGDIKIESGTGSKSITGGAFQIGNASTPASQTILVNSAIALNNLTVNSANATARLAAALTLNGNVNISAGALDANNLNMSVAGNWTNDGTFTAGSGKVTFNGGSTSTYGGSSTTTLYDLQINSGTTLDVGTSALFDVTNSLRNQGKLKQTQTITTSNVAFLNVASGKYYGLEIDPEGSTSMGSTTVTISGEQTCPSPPSLGVTPVKRCFDIAPTTPTTATVKFWWDGTNELNGNVAASVKVYHQESGLWYTENGAYSRGTAGGFDWVQVTGVDDYSPFALTSNTPSSPTLITLAFFTATAYRDHVLIAWETGSEVDNAGFYLWRASTAAGPYTRLNSTVIPAQGCPTQGARYTYVDRDVTPGVVLRLRSGQVYWYQLEDVDIHGHHTFHTLTIRASLPVYSLYLPWIQK